MGELGAGSGPAVEFQGKTDAEAGIVVGIEDAHRADLDRADTLRARPVDWIGEGDVGVARVEVEKLAPEIPGGVAAGSAAAGIGAAVAAGKRILARIGFTLAAGGKFDSGAVGIAGEIRCRLGLLCGQAIPVRGRRRVIDVLSIGRCTGQAECEASENSATVLHNSGPPGKIG